MNDAVVVPPGPKAVNRYVWALLHGKYTVSDPLCPS